LNFGEVVCRDPEAGEVIWLKYSAVLGYHLGLADAGESVDTSYYWSFNA
jgi:hypothetical protein